MKWSIVAWLTLATSFPLPAQAANAAPFRIEIDSTDCQTADGLLGGAHRYGDPQHPQHTFLEADHPKELHKDALFVRVMCFFGHSVEVVNVCFHTTDYGSLRRSVSDELRKRYKFVETRSEKPQPGVERESSIFRQGDSYIQLQFDSYGAEMYGLQVNYYSSRVFHNLERVRQEELRARRRPKGL